VRLLPDDLVDGTLPKPGIVRAGKLFTMHRDLAVGEFGRVKGAKLAEVLAKLRQLFSK
jgi:hypothetical protein